MAKLGCYLGVPWAPLHGRELPLPMGIGSSLQPRNEWEVVQDGM